MNLNTPGGRALPEEHSQGLAVRACALCRALLLLHPHAPHVPRLARALAGGSPRGHGAHGHPLGARSRSISCSSSRLWTSPSTRSTREPSMACCTRVLRASPAARREGRTGRAARGERAAGEASAPRWCWWAVGRPPRIGDSSRATTAWSPSRRSTSWAQVTLPLGRRWFLRLGRRWLRDGGDARRAVTRVAARAALSLGVQPSLVFVSSASLRPAAGECCAAPR